MKRIYESDARLDERNVDLVSVDFIKNNTRINNNNYAKIIKEQIAKIQDDHLLPIIGTHLLHKLQYLIYHDEIDLDDNKDYWNLLTGPILDFFIPYVEYFCILALQYDIRNKGLTKTNDNYTQNATLDEINVNMAGLANNMAQAADNLSLYLEARQSIFPEMSRCCRGEEKKPKFYRYVRSAIYFRKSPGCGCWYGYGKNKFKKYE